MLYLRNVDSELEVCMGMEMAGIPRNPRVSRGYGCDCCGNTAGMDPAIAGFPRGWIFFRRGPRGNGRQIRLWKIL